MNIDLFMGLSVLKILTYQSSIKHRNGCNVEKNNYSLFSRAYRIITTFL